MHIFRLLSSLLCLALIGCATTAPSELPPDLDERIQAAVEEAVDNTFRSYIQDSSFKGEVLRRALNRAEITEMRLAQENLEHLLITSLIIASDAQAWKIRDSRFGGGEQANGFQGLTFSRLPYRLDEHGRYRSSGGYCKLEIRGDDYHAIVLCYSTVYEQQVVFKLTGPTLEGMNLEVSKYDPEVTFDLKLTPSN